MNLIIAYDCEALVSRYELHSYSINPNYIIVIDNKRHKIREMQVYEIIVDDSDKKTHYFIEESTFNQLVYGENY